jgi:hypothetical protein
MKILFDFFKNLFGFISKKDFYEMTEDGRFIPKEDSFINKMVLLFKIMLPIFILTVIILIISFTYKIRLVEVKIFETNAQYICFTTDTSLDNCLVFTENKNIKIINQEDLNLLRLEIK